MHFLLLVLAAAPVSVPLGEGIVFADAPRGPIVFAVAEPSGVEAIDARTGKVLWRNRAANLPLLEHQGVLLASQLGTGKRPQPPLVALDARTGKRRFEVAIPEPAGELVRGMNGPGVSVSVGAFRLGGEDYLLAGSSRCYAGGAALRNPPPCQTSRAIVRIDWHARRAVAADEVNPPPPHAHDQQDRHAIEIVTATGARGEAMQPPAGDLVYRPPHGETVVLARRAGHVSLWPSVSADGAVVAGSSQRAAGAVPAGITYDVSFFDAESGATLGSCALEEPPMPFVVRGERVIYSWAHHVAAIDLPSCRRLYSVPVRDLAYRGPMPP